MRITLLLSICLAMALSQCQAQYYRSGKKAVVSGANISIYLNSSLESPWTSEETAIDAASAEQAVSGTSIKVVGTAWASVGFRNGVWGSTTLIDASQYASVNVSVHGGATGGMLNLYLEDATGTRVGTAVSFAITAGAWTNKTFLMTDINPSDVAFGVIGFQVFDADATFYLDNFSIVHK